jgi:hypothetical protein
MEAADFSKMNVTTKQHGNTGQISQAVMLSTCIPKVLSLNLGNGIGYSDRFPEVLLSPSMQVLG